MMSSAQVPLATAASMLASVALQCCALSVITDASSPALTAAAAASSAAEITSLIWDLTVSRAAVRFLWARLLSRSRSLYLLHE